ncbi:MAG: hypothetical protein AB7J13_06155, partial [Pyrinomonadaceae bacterium]
MTASISARFLTGLFLLATVFLSGYSQAPTQAPASTSDSPTASPTPSPTPIGPSAIVSESEAVAARLKEIQTYLREKPRNAAIRSAIPEIVNEMDRLTAETNSILDGRPTLDDLNNLERDWQGPGGTIAEWTDELDGQVTELDKRIAELRSMKERWQSLLDTMTTAPAGNANTPDFPGEQLPSELLERLRSSIASIAETQKASEERRSELLALQSRVADLESRVTAVVAEIKDRRVIMLSRLFVREDPAIWNVRSDRSKNISAHIAEAMNSRFTAFSEYAAANTERFVLHGFVLVLFIAAFAWARRRLLVFAEQDVKVERAADIFRHPIAAAFVMSIFLSGAIYPQAPKLMTAILGVAAMIPVVIILRRLIDKPAFIIVCVLVGFYLFDRVREISSDIPLLSRLQFLTEMLVAVLLLIYFQFSKRIESRVAAGKRRLFDILRRVAPFAIAIFSAAFFANLVGAVNLSNIIGNGVLRSIYAALVIYTAAQVIDGLTIFVLRVRPLSGLGMVRT